MNCDRIARWYRWLEYLSFGRALECRRLEYLPDVRESRRVLMLGEGDGRFTAAFAQHNECAAVLSIDSSREMVRLAAKRVSACERVTFRCTDVFLVNLPVSEYDLIVTHFFLDCFSTEEAATLIEKISKAAAPRARWLISEFQLPDAGFARYCAAFLIQVCYFVFRLTTGLKTTHLPEYRSALCAKGFTRVRYKVALGGLLISELWDRP